MNASKEGGIFFFFFTKPLNEKMVSKNLKENSLKNH
jgi:hypothetical protein